jgi:hypothetical protein
MTPTVTATAAAAATTTIKPESPKPDHPKPDHPSPDSGNFGLISHIQKLIELNTSIMTTIQAQLAAQGNILKSILEESIASNVESR